MGDPFVSFAVAGAAVTIDLRVGHIRRFEVEVGGRILAPLHTAPWVDDPVITDDASIPASLRFLSGDFFCAPFGVNDLSPGPAHGFPAAGPWRHLENASFEGGVTARFELELPVLGARVTKLLTLRDRHPFLYEQHVFQGGEGAIPVANHAMTRFGPSGGCLAFSPKAFAFTPTLPLESDPARGRSTLVYPTCFVEATRPPLVAGGRADLSHYPIADQHEDFVALVEAPDSPLGWFAAVRTDEQDVFLSLKNPKDYPFTFLWFSNGGRDYPPWNGRHLNVLGIEEGRALASDGHRASIATNPLNEAGYPTALALDPDNQSEVRNVIGALPFDTSSCIADIVADDERLFIIGDGGMRTALPFDRSFLFSR